VVDQLFADLTTAISRVLEKLDVHGEVRQQGTALSRLEEMHPAFMISSSGDCN
jgi:hypothetical protein